MKVLALTKILKFDKPTIRFLCSNSAVGTDRLKQILGVLPYPCYNLDIVLVDIDEAYYLDFDLDASIMPNITITSCERKFEVKQLRSKSKFLNLLHLYYPKLAPQERYFSLGNYKFFSDGWLSYLDTPLCLWKPSFKDTNIKAHLTVEDDSLVYRNVKEVFLLTNIGSRHRSALLGEIFTIDRGISHCARHLYYINDNNCYIETVQVFNILLRSWITVSDSEPTLVLGRKDK